MHRRKPAIEGIGLERIELIRNREESTWMKRQDKYSGVYAAGDVNGARCSHIPRTARFICINNMLGKRTLLGIMPFLQLYIRTRSSLCGETEETASQRNRYETVSLSMKYSAGM